MSAEYSVEEVRAQRDGLRSGNYSKADLLHMQRMLNAYASLLERIKADESAVPVAQLRLRLDRWDVVGIHGEIEKLHLPTGEYPLFTRPPAQAAQMDGMCNADNPARRCVCREEFGRRVCEPVAQAAAWMNADGGVCTAEAKAKFAHLRDYSIPLTRVTAKPLAEPAAQGELPTEMSPNAAASYRLGWRDALAAQPRAVTDGWVLVPEIATQAMVDAGSKEWRHQSVFGIWEAMLAAAGVPSHDA